MIIEGLSAREVSEKLGVNPNLLYRWKRQHLQELAGDKLERHAAFPHPCIVLPSDSQPPSSIP